MIQFNCIHNMLQELTSIAYDSIPKNLKHLLCILRILLSANPVRIAHADSLDLPLSLLYLAPSIIPLIPSLSCFAFTFHTLLAGFLNYIASYRFH